MSLLVDIEKRLDTFTLRVQFEAEHGATALLGASGCGKSVTLKCIAGIEKPDEGRIVLDGRVLYDSAARVNLPPQQRQVGYLFQKAFWHKGYATEAAIACKNYAFQVLGAKEVYSIIRDNNLASQNVAKRNGMKVCGKIVKHYYNMDMPHLLFKTEKNCITIDN